ncbi:YciI family protein [Dactylosporangium sp. AC04546]|uniref:YciI family protein n=1 Tax=Dactylosporangium sp. AC04546 TaxID=2862460 RepID=UPI001EDF0B29|nr:YciI family protein [Dactylosporangium sp. AC04546]WVK79554.1 YciI family protein [Dactylosporangium sp. AC04546]
MRFLIMSKTNDYFEAGNPPSPELFERMGRFIQEMAAAGVLLQADGLLPSSTGARICAHDGEISVTDGPFAESKELIGGLAFIEARDLAEATEWGRRFVEAHDGECEVEIRQVAGLAGPGDHS